MARSCRTLARESATRPTCARAVRHNNSANRAAARAACARVRCACAPRLQAARLAQRLQLRHAQRRGRRAAVRRALGCRAAHRAGLGWEEEGGASTCDRPNDVRAPFSTLVFVETRRSFRLACIASGRAHADSKRAYSRAWRDGRRVSSTTTLASLRPPCRRSALAAPAFCAGRGPAPCLTRCSRFWRWPRARAGARRRRWWRTPRPRRASSPSASCWTCRASKRRALLAAAALAFPGACLTAHRALRLACAARGHGVCAGAGAAAPVRLRHARGLQRRAPARRPAFLERR